MNSFVTRSARRVLAGLAMSVVLASGGCAKVETAEEPEQAAEPVLAGTPIDASEVAELAVVGCAACGGPRGDGQSFLEYEGKQYGFCCPGCMRLFREDPAKSLGSEASAGEGTEGAGPPRTQTGQEPGGD